jgi:hypothetical protein
MIAPQAAGELTAQHLALVAQHEELSVLGQSDRTSTASRPDKHLSMRQASGNTTSR